MSRHAAAALLLALSGAASPPVAAQSASARSAIEDARAAYGPQAPRPKCPTVQQGEEIVVCAEEQEQSQFRIRSDADAENDYARETMDKDAPRAPDVAGPGIFKGKATASFGNVPPPAYMIDFAALPDTPPGSDADRVGQGLAPAGGEAGIAGQTGAPFPGAIVTTVAREPVSPRGSASPAEAPSGSQTPGEVQAPE